MNMKILKMNDFISERVKIKPVTNAEWDKAKKDMSEKIELGRRYKHFMIQEDKHNSAEELDKYGKGLNTESALEFIKKVIDEIGNRYASTAVTRFGLFYSGYQGFVLYDELLNKKGYILFDGPWYSLEDYGPGKGWYIETDGNTSYGFDNIVKELLKIK